MSEHTPTLLFAQGALVGDDKGEPFANLTAACVPISAPSFEERKANANRVVATWNAFEDPAGRTIATEDIAEGTFWRMYDLLKILEAAPPDYGTGETARALLSSLKVQGPEK